MRRSTRHINPSERKPCTCRKSGWNMRALPENSTRKTYIQMNDTFAFGEEGERERAKEIIYVTSESLPWVWSPENKKQDIKAAGEACRGAAGSKIDIWRFYNISSIPLQCFMTWNNSEFMRQHRKCVFSDRLTLARHPKTKFPTQTVKSSYNN